MSSEKIPVIPQRKVERKSKRSRRMIVFLFFTTVFLIVFFNSDLSKVTHIEIEGLSYMKSSEIEAVLDVSVGDSFFLVKRDALQRNVDNLSAVQKASVEKKFPGTIIIQVEEHPAVAVQYESNGEARIVLSNGERIAIQENGVPLHVPILSGWDVEDPMWIRLCETLAEIPTPYLADVSEIIPIPTPSYPDKLQIFTRSKFEVITAISYLSDMMSVLDNVILELKQDGVKTGRVTMLETITWNSFAVEQGEEEIEEN